MKKIIVLILLVSGHMRAAQVGLAQRRITTPMEQLQELSILGKKSRKALCIVLNETLEAYSKVEAMQKMLECLLESQNLPIITQKNLLLRTVANNPDILQKNEWLIKKCDN